MKKICLAAALLLSFPALLPAPVADSELVHCQMMVASWYGPHFHGKKTANGETFNQFDPTTAAHKFLPLGTRLLVCRDLLCIYVRINDRGPYVVGRDLDLSAAAAQRLGIKREGVAKVRVYILS